MSAAPRSRPSRALDVVSAALFVSAGAALGAMVLLTLWEVVARYAFDAPTTWTAEAAGYALAAVVFAGLPEVTRRNAHVAIDVLPVLLPPRAGAALVRITDAVAGLTAGIAAAIVAREAWRQLGRGLMTNAAVPVPRWPITAVIALGLGLAALVLIRQALRR